MDGKEEDRGVRRNPKEVEGGYGKRFGVAEAPQKTCCDMQARRREDKIELR